MRQKPLPKNDHQNKTKQIDKLLLSSLGDSQVERMNSFTVETTNRFRRKIQLHFEQRSFNQYRVSCPKGYLLSRLKGLSFDGGRVNEDPFKAQYRYHLTITRWKKIYERDGRTYVDVETTHDVIPIPDEFNWDETKKDEMKKDKMKKDKMKKDKMKKDETKMGNCSDQLP